MNPVLPETLLADWRAAGLPFAQQPRLVRSLGGGAVNRAVLIEADGDQYVLRTDGAHAPALGVDHAREFLIHARAAQAGLAPAVLTRNPDRGYLLTHYCAGRKLAPETLTAAEREALLASVAAVSRMTVDIPPFDYRAHAVRLTSGAELPGHLEQAIRRLGDSAPRGLCHHDVTPENVIYDGGRVWLIDWEYAAVGYPAVDFAALVCDWLLDADDVAAAADVPRGVLDQACDLYRGLGELWTARLRALSVGDA